MRTCEDEGVPRVRAARREAEGVERERGREGEVGRESERGGERRSFGAAAFVSPIVSLTASILPWCAGT